MLQQVLDDEGRIAEEDEVGLGDVVILDIVGALLMQLEISTIGSQHCSLKCEDKTHLLKQ